MENQNYEMSQSGSLDSQNPPADSEKQLPNDDQQHPEGIHGQGPFTQPPQQSAVVIPVQPTHEPDYLVYSIFTMVCCCIPLGIGALIFSLQTRDANRIGDGAAARQNSRRARNFARSALGVGLVVYVAIIVYIILTIVKAVNSQRHQEVKFGIRPISEEFPDFPN